MRTLTDCHFYKCVVVFDKADGYDCAKPALGHVGRACSTSAPATCPTGVVASFGISNVNNCDLEQCTYSCQRVKN